MPSTRQPKVVMHGDSDDDEGRRLSAEEVQKGQELGFGTIRHRSQSLGAMRQLSSASGTNKRAMLQALGLVLDSNVREL